MTNDIQVGKHFMLHNGARKDVEIRHIPSNLHVAWVHGRKQARDLIKLIEPLAYLDWNGTTDDEVFKHNNQNGLAILSVIFRFKESRPL